VGVEFKEQILASECKLFFIKTINNILTWCILARTFELTPTNEQVIFFVRTNSLKLHSFYLVIFYLIIFPVLCVFIFIFKPIVPVITVMIIVYIHSKSHKFLFRVGMTKWTSTLYICLNLLTLAGLKVHFVY